MSGTLSPDGNWLWNGTEWIPAPPKDAPPQTQSLQNQDTGVNVSQITTPSQSIDTESVSISGNTQTSQNLQPKIALSINQNNNDGNLKQFSIKGRYLLLIRERTNMTEETFDLLPQYISQNSRYTMTHRWNTNYRLAGKQYNIHETSLTLMIVLTKKAEKISILGSSSRWSILFFPYAIVEMFLLKSRFVKYRREAMEIATLIEDFLSQNE